VDDYQRPDGYPCLFGCCFPFHWAGFAISAFRLL
jgi:hypothetical protein